MECAPACRPTCRNPSPNPDCHTRRCLPGCYCPFPTVLHRGKQSFLLIPNSCPLVLRKGTLFTRYSSVIILALLHLLSMNSRGSLFHELVIKQNSPYTAKPPDCWNVIVSKVVFLGICVQYYNIVLYVLFDRFLKGSFSQVWLD